MTRTSDLLFRINWFNGALGVVALVVWIVAIVRLALSFADSDPGQLVQAAALAVIGLACFVIGTALGFIWNVARNDKSNSK